MSTDKQNPVGVMRASSEVGVAPYADIWLWLEPGTKLYTSPPIEHENCSAAVAAIAYALEHPCESPMEFLRCWNEGNFEALRTEWPDVPPEVFIGADPLYQKAKGNPRRIGENS